MGWFLLRSAWPLGTGWGPVKKTMGEKGSGHPLDEREEGSQADSGFWTGWVPRSTGLGAVVGLGVSRPCVLCVSEVARPCVGTEAGRTCGFRGLGSLWGTPVWGESGGASWEDPDELDSMLLSLARGGRLLILP